MPVRYFETNSLLGVALDAATSIKASPRNGGQKPTLISIVFAMVSLEAFINEITELALDSNKYQPPIDPPVIAIFGEGMVEAEDCHASLESKLRLGHWILSGKKLDKGTQSYQDFSLLLHLRNRLLHFTANPAFEQSTSPEEVHADLTRKFRSKNILAEDAQGIYPTWTFLIETKAVAEWSCQTAARMIVDFCSKVPQSTLKPFCNQLEQALAIESLFRKPSPEMSFRIT